MENNSMESATLNAASFIISPEALLDHWQGHRRLSRRVIEAFPEEEFYHFSIGGMRTFSELTMEIMDLSGPGIKGIATRHWKGYGEDGQNGHTSAPQTKEEVLAKWDAITEQINTTWPEIPQQRFQETDKAFGQWEMPVYAALFYFIDNEIHHRGQGYVYLRALGIEPPAFWDRH